MSTKFTPGPWKIGTPPPNGEQTIGTAQGLMVAVATTGAGVQTKANAILIAAAPDLLEALQDCERVMSEELKGLLVIQPELKNARAAIAKAEATLTASQPADDGWIPWEGGDCPVGSEVVTKVKVRGGDVDAGKAHFYDWHHDGSACDIVAYRVVKP